MARFFQEAALLGETMTKNGKIGNAVGGGGNTDNTVA